MKRTGLGISLFYEMRYDHQGKEIEDFILNTDPFNKSKILVAGDNFGCGSSREYAPWSLKDFGISCIISTSFADIFYNNCFQNGILPIVVSADNSKKLMELASEKKEFDIDLPSQTIRVEDTSINFDIEEYRKQRLLEGLDDIGITMNYEQNISDYELKQKNNKPWIFKDV
ncbi:MAG: 3-isopropylmalate dehydratase small subunit [Pelagibacteraceae bacterium]|nr:3-isopropylmalate dehydratase small subunit [Pelagibacteraceae bacterium]